MANTNIRGLVGFNPTSGTARLLAAYEDDIVNAATGTGYGLNINTTNNVEFEIFLNRVFFQNNTNRPLTYKTSTNKWTNEHVGRTPVSKYQQQFKSRLFLGYCSFPSPQTPVDGDGNNLSFPSRVFYSDLFSGPELTWGIEWGRNGTVSPQTSFFNLQAQGMNYPLQQDFKARNIKVGDPIIITSTDTAASRSELVKTFLVTKVDSPYRLSLNATFSGQTNLALLDYWVGSNWFDVGADDGDVITGFGENSNRLIIFKLLSLWFYTGSQLVQVSGSVGTSSQRSVINDSFGRTYYFHGSDPKITGVYRYDGNRSVKISRGIDPFIKGMSTTNYTAVVAWSEGNELRWYVGDLAATNTTEAMTNAVITYNVDTQAWSVDSVADVITDSTVWRTANQESTYLGTSDSEIILTDSGNSQNGAAFSLALETKVYYPAGPELINGLSYVQVIGRSLRGMRLKYKLWDNPTEVDTDWWALGELDGDKTEFRLPLDHDSASGIQFRFDEMGTVENDAYVERLSFFYKPNRVRLLGE